MADYEVGVDIGGTFTDLVMVDTKRSLMWVNKVPSTPPDFADGLLSGLEDILADADVDASQVRRLVHGATVATNTILERSGARLGILMTQGFRDVLYVGKANRRKMYDLFMDPDEPTFLAPRRQIGEVGERVDAHGNVIIPLDEASLLATIRDLVNGHGIDAVVLCFLHSYANPEHERRAREVIARAYPGLPVSLSSDIDPRWREYERLVVTALDAYVRPVVVNYLRELQSSLNSGRWRIPLQVMQSRGGITGAEACTERPVTTVLSGPAAGVVGASRIAEEAGFPNCITFDMGGTSADVALVKAGRPVLSGESSIGGYPLRLPMVDVETVGAGGGSIAWLDPAGVMKVGPQSAGARPGPAAYQQGGTSPTVTDASLLLGYLSPDSFAGGISLDLDAATEAINATIAKPLGLDPPAAALGIHEIVNSRMAQTLRLVSVGRGEDPRLFTLVALGGAGSIHASRLAAELSMTRVLIPRTPGVCSAFGLLHAPVEHDFARTFRGAADEVSLSDLGSTLEELDHVCARLMRRDGVDPEGARAEHYADMRYVGQSYELEVLVPQTLTEEARDAIIQSFHKTHEQLYSYAKKGEQVEFVALRSVHSSIVSQQNEPTLVTTAEGHSQRPDRPVCFARSMGYVMTPVFWRDALGPDAAIPGPAIIEQPDTTVVVYPGDVAQVQPGGCIVINIGKTEV